MEASSIVNDECSHRCAARQDTVPVQAMSSEIYWDLMSGPLSRTNAFLTSVSRGFCGCVLMVASFLFIIIPLYLAGLYLTLPVHQNWQKNTGLISRAPSKLSNQGEPSYPTLMLPCPLDTLRSTSVMRSLFSIGEGCGPWIVKLYTADHGWPFRAPHCH